MAEETQKSMASTPQVDIPSLEEVDRAAKGSLMSRMNPLGLFRRETSDRYLSEGHEFVENRQYAQAGMAYQRAIDLAPADPKPKVAMAEMLLKKGGSANLKLALEFFSGAVVLDPLNEGIYHKSAMIYHLLGKKKEEALEKKKMAVVKTLEVEPKNPIANNNMGILMLQQNQIPAAFDYFRRALQGNPQYDVAMRNIALACLKLAAEEPNETVKRDQLEKARGFVGRALSIHDSAPNLLVKARLMLVEGKFDECLNVLGKAEALDPLNKELFQVKRSALVALGRREEAEQAESMFTTLLSGDLQ